MSTSVSPLRLDVEDGIANITFDNPPVNAISAVMMQKLRNVLDRLRDNTAVQVIVFRSANPTFFLAHVDMAILEQEDALEQLAAAALPGLNIFQTVGELLRNQPQITIVELAGIARGGGAEFVAAADMAFAATETAGLGQIETLMGIVPSGGGTQYLAERVGRNRALEIVLTGELWDASTAAMYGWINRAVPAADLDGFVRRTARRIADLPDGVAPAAKRVLAAAPPMDGYRREETEWAQLIAAPAAPALMAEALRSGAQTAAGEIDLEGLMRRARTAVRGAVTAPSA